MHYQQLENRTSKRSMYALTKVGHLGGEHHLVNVTVFIGQCKDYGLI